MKVKIEEASDAARGCHEDWEDIEERIVEQRRWATLIEKVCKHKPSGKHYCFSFDRGSTEAQDYVEPFEGETEVEFREVVQKEVTVRQWVIVESNK